jgi:hypothetical protein
VTTEDWDTPTTRRFSRTTWQAFPDERAYVIEIGPRPLLWRLWRWLCGLIR